MKKLFLFLAGFCFLSGVFALVNFLDYAEYLADKKVIVRQRPEANYRLSSNVLRQEIVGIAIRLTHLNFRDVDRIELPDPYTCENTFRDVRQDTPNTWVCRSAEIAAKNAIVSTYNPLFRPQDPVTRAEAIAMILSAVRLAPIVTRHDEWQSVMMKSAVDLDILPAEDAAPDEFISRGEVFYMISRVTKVLYKRELLYLDSL